jgi:hypothetical protein
MTIHLGRAARHGTGLASDAMHEDRRLPPTAVLGVAVRCLLVGFALAQILVAGAGGGALLTAAILALGAALLSWNE